MRSPALRIGAAVFLVSCAEAPGVVVPPVTVALAPEPSASNSDEPYLWLENDDDPKVTSWFEVHDREARREIAKLQGTKELIAEMGKLYEHPLTRLPTRRGDLVFAQRGTSIVMSRKGSTDASLTIFTAKEAEGRLGGWSPSPDGSLLFAELSRNGADMRTARITDTKTLADLDSVDGLEDSRVVWRDRGFFYAYTPPSLAHADRWANREIRYHAIGTPQANDRIVVPASHDKDASSSMNPLSLTKDRTRLLVRTFGNWSFTTYGIVDLTKPSFSLTELPPTVEHPVVVENAIYAFIRRPDGSGDIGRFGPGVATPELLAPMPAELLDVEALGKTLVVTRSAKAGTEANGFVTRTFYDSSFRRLDERTTHRGLTEHYDAYPDSPTMILTREGLGVPEHRLEYDPRTGKTTSNPAFESRVAWDTSAFVTDTLSAKSKDGTTVPITILHRKDIKLDGKAKLAVYGYGGFKNSAEQVFYPPWMAWAAGPDRVFASCHIRGGMEFGEAWHEAGARRKRQNTIDDFHACIAQLHKSGYGAPATTVTQGWSHGGMLVAAAAIQRPDLQRVVIAIAPLADMIRFPIYGRGGVTEYGNPDDPGDRAALAAFSPVHNVKDGVRYPAFFITTPSKDERVHPMHGRKLAAALEHAGGGTVLLKVLWDAGHHGGGKDDANATLMEGFSFALAQMTKGKVDVDE